MEQVEQTEKLLTFIGHKIADEAPNLDLKVIHKIFKETAATQVGNNIFSWSLFDWVDANDKQTVNTMLGINAINPPNTSDRFYSGRDRKKWQLLFSNIIFGSPSGVRVIPVGLQISTKNFTDAGVIAVGLHVGKITNLIESKIGKYSHFAVIDNQRVDFSFGSEGSSVDDGIFRANIDLPTTSKAGNVYIYKVDLDQKKCPYSIVTGYDKREFWHEVFRNSALQFFQICAIFLLVTCLRNTKL